MLERRHFRLVFAIKDWRFGEIVIWFLFLNHFVVICKSQLEGIVCCLLQVDRHLSNLGLIFFNKLSFWVVNKINDDVSAKLF